VGNRIKTGCRPYFNEKVWALLGSHDGRNAHLVEQAATKSTVVFVSAWPADPTLAQAFVPWFFNCIPNDIQQAELLAEDIITEKNSGRVVIISGKDYDSQLSLTAFLRAADPGKKQIRSYFIMKIIR
jgi:ABC-type branched-subunit amino acid transport system substrate-binding protein